MKPDTCGEKMITEGAHMRAGRLGTTWMSNRHASTSQEARAGVER